MPKGKCIYLDYATNSCMCRNAEQCEGRETCSDYEEDENA